MFIEHLAVLHDLAIKECLWERKNLFHNAEQSFVFSHQGDSPLVPASGYATGRWGNWIMKIPWAGDCSFFSLIDGRIPSGSQGGSVQYLIQRAQTYVIRILFLERKKKDNPWQFSSRVSIV